MKVLFIDTVHPHLMQQLLANGFTCDEDYTSKIEDVVKKIDTYYGIIIRSRFKINKQFIDAAVQLKFVARVGAGMENIDVEYAESKGIKCLHAPEGNRTAVAEHAIGMLLSLFNNINRADNQVRQNTWIREGNRGIELEGKTFAIIGYGNMGSALAQRLQGFGVNVLCYDKYKTNYADANLCKETNMQTIFVEADIVSFHLPYNAETHYLLNENYISKFKKPFYFINTSRGKIVDTAALVEAMRNHKILGACLDVIEYEGTSFENINNNEHFPFYELKKMHNVVLTPHIAGWTHESNYKMADVLVQKIMATI